MKTGSSATFVVLRAYQANIGSYIMMRLSVSSYVSTEARKTYENQRHNDHSTNHRN